MRKGMRAWRAVPLPFDFHASLDDGDWQKALSFYHAHPFHSPPVDTFDMLKSIINATSVKAEHIKRRFGDKVRISLSLQKRQAEEVDWELFWTALNNGDSKTISMALAGARIGGVSSQVGVAEACAVLLRCSGKKWKQELVDSSPYGTVSKSNIVGASLGLGRWDIACEILSHTKVTKQDMVGLWSSVASLQWEQSLRVISMCPKYAVPYEEFIGHLLTNGCDLVTLSEFLESAKVLGDPSVVAPLLKEASRVENWPFALRCMEHLVDIGSVSVMAHKTFLHLCEKHTIKKVVGTLDDKGIPLQALTIEVLEECSFE